MSDQMLLTPLSQSIVKTLLYYDIFNYPLKVNEIYRFLDSKNMNETEIDGELKFLCDRHLVFKFGDFFSLQNSERNVIRRVKGNDQAKKYLEIAKQKGKLIMQFPFVSAVMASGSLSKEFMDENSDIDFFIATKPGRLWIARTLLILYKRLFLFNSHKYFCVNYFVDTDHMGIEERNIFTATELATVIPLYGAEYYQKLHQTNSWVTEIFPNYHPRSIDGVPPSIQTGMRKLIEKLIDIFFGNVVNKFFMSLTLGRWKRLYRKNYSEADFEVAFKTKKHVSKNHPKHYQRKVVDLYDDKWKEFQQRLSADYRIQPSPIITR